MHQFVLLTPFDCLSIPVSNVLTAVRPIWLHLNNSVVRVQLNATHSKGAPVYSVNK